MGDLFQDGIDFFRPDERLGIVVVGPDEVLDSHDEFLDIAENTATNALPRNLSEPSFHEI